MIFSVFFILIVGSVIAFGLYSRPIIRQFIIAILFFAAVYRCLYLLFAEMTYRLLLGYDLDKNFNLSKYTSNNKSVIDSITGKAGKSVASEHGTINQSGSSGHGGTLAQMSGKSWTEEVLDKEIELCKANVTKYQARLLELQEMAVSRAVLVSSGSNPSSVEAQPPKLDPTAGIQALSSSVQRSTSIDVGMLASTTERASTTDKGAFMIRTLDSNSTRPKIDYDIAEQGVQSYHLGDAEEEGKNDHSDEMSFCAGAENEHAATL